MMKAKDTLRDSSLMSLAALYDDDDGDSTKKSDEHHGLVLLSGVIRFVKILRKQ